MRLRSALEDFETNTLGALPGLLGRIVYLGRLHDGNGVYDHWGLAKVYGDNAAQHAMHTSHRGLLSEVLRKPLVVLFNDIATSCSSEHLTEEELLVLLAQSPPKPLSRSARAHLGSVLGALSALIEEQKSANLRDASQPQRPVLEPRPPVGI
jgi:hypothetical protein